jgi:hypothetical protein
MAVNCVPGTFLGSKFDEFLSKFQAKFPHFLLGKIQDTNFKIIDK